MADTKENIIASEALTCKRCKVPEDLASLDVSRYMDGAE